jgi:hypothetical protein
MVSYTVPKFKFPLKHSDEQLQELMKSAFANVKASMDCLRLEIAQARAAA